MKRFVWLLCIVIVALVVALAIHHAPGYVLVHYGTYSVAAPLWMVVLGIAILAVLAYLLWQGAAWLFDLPGRFRHFRRQRRLNQQKQLLSTALNALLTRDWTAAQNHFAKLAAKDYLPTHCLLLAAEAAQAQGQEDRKRDYMHQAAILTTDKTTTHMRQLHQFDQLLAEGETAAAATLMGTLANQIKKKVLHPRQLQLALAQQAWRSAVPLITHASEPERVRIYQGLLQKSADENGESLRKAWHELPKHRQEHPALVCTYITLLHRHHDDDHAHQTARAFLNQHWSDAVFVKFAENHPDASALHDAEKWLKDQPQTADNQYALALLQQQQHLFERAKLTLQNSLGLRPTHRAAQQLLALACVLQDSTLQQKAIEILNKKT